MKEQLVGRPARYHARSLPERLSESQAGAGNLGRRGARTGAEWGEPAGLVMGWLVDLLLFALQLVLWCIVSMLKRESAWRLRMPRIGRRIGERVGRAGGGVGGGLLGGVCGAGWGALSGRAPAAPSPYRTWSGG
jgi:hypothetical protein